LVDSRGKERLGSYRPRTGVDESRSDNPWWPVLESLLVDRAVC
jgi:hypothetical protein